MVLDEEIRISGAPVVNELRLHYARSDWTRKHARTVLADSTTSAYARSACSTMGRKPRSSQATSFTTPRRLT